MWFEVELIIIHNKRAHSIAGHKHTHMDTYNQNKFTQKIATSFQRETGKKTLATTAVQTIHHR